MLNIKELKFASNNLKTPKEIRWLINAVSRFCKNIEDVEKILNSHGNPNFKFSIELHKSFDNSHYLKLFTIQGGLFSPVQLNNLSTSKAGNEFFSRVKEIEEKYSNEGEENTNIEEDNATPIIEYVDQKTKEPIENKNDEDNAEEEKEVKYDKQKIKELIENKKLYDKFNKEQGEAIYSELKPQCVIAGAGTGKTRILVNRFCYLVGEKNIDPKRILVITFTKKAATEIKERILKKLNLDEKTKMEYICTFHSFFLKVLKKDLSKMDENLKEFKVIDQDVKSNFIRKSCLDINLKIEDFQEYFWKNLSLFLTKHKQENSEENILKYSQELDIEVEDLEKIIELYIENLKNINSLDFDDFETKINELFENNEKIRKKWSEKFDAILIDEFQDTSPKQFEAIKKITNINSNIFVVGDPDQSIYGFRNAMPQSFNKFIEHFQINSPFKLQQNFRSTKNILKISNMLIGKNPRDEKLKKELWGNKEEGKKVIYELAFGEKESEIELIVEKISKLIYEDKVKQDDIAILYRNTPHWKYYQKMVYELKKIGVNYKTQNQKSIFINSEEIRFIIALLNIVILDDSSFCYINDFLENSSILPKKSKSFEVLKEIWNFCEWSRKNKYKLSQAIKNISSAELNKEVVSLLRGMYHLVESWREECNKLPIDIWLETFLSEKREKISFMGDREWKFNYLNIKKMLKFLKQKSTKEENKGEIVKSIFFGDFEENDKNEKHEKSGVFLDTVHQSKGLEWKYVFLIGVSKNFPLKKNGKETNIEEERRIVYVAFTRAQNELILTGTASKKGDRSMFVDEDMINSGAIEINYK